MTYILATLWLLLGFGLPYGLEQLAYSRFAPQADQRYKTTPGLRAYGWAGVWDAALYLGFALVIYRLFFTLNSLTVYEWIGYGLYLSGTGLRCWALRELGDLYDLTIVIHNDHKVVTSGPFRLMRHPLHFGNLLQISGLVCFGPWWLALLVILIAYTVVCYLNRLEDRLLLERLGSDYQVYYRRRWDVIDLILPKNLIP